MPPCAAITLPPPPPQRSIVRMTGAPHSWWPFLSQDRTVSTPIRTAFAERGRSVGRERIIAACIGGGELLIFLPCILRSLRHQKYDARSSCTTQAAARFFNPSSHFRPRTQDEKTSILFRRRIAILIQMPTQRLGEIIHRFNTRGVIEIEARLDLMAFSVPRRGGKQARGKIRLAHA